MRVILIALVAARLLRTERAELRAGASLSVKLHSRAGARASLGARLGAKGQLRPADMLYTSVKIGTPPQEFLVAIDTSSGHLLIPSKDCPSQGCLAHRYYDPVLSTTGKALATLDNLEGSTSGGRETATFSFARGSVTGGFATDVVCLGSMCVEMYFVEATQMSDEPFGLVPYDGILGLGMPQLSTSKTFNFIGQLVGAGKLQRTQFAIWLSRKGNHGENDDEDSELTIGTFDSNRLASEVVWSPITAQPGGKMSGFWQITVQDVSVDNVGQTVCAAGTGCQAIADTSTTALGLPQSIYDLLMSQGAAVKADCSNMASLPKIGLNIGGYVLNLRSEDYVIRSADKASCASLLEPLDVPAPRGPLLLLGTPFLTAFYSIYDRETLKVGLALASHKHLKAEEVPELFFKPG